MEVECCNGADRQAEDLPASGQAECSAGGEQEAKDLPASVEDERAADADQEVDDSRESMEDESSAIAVQVAGEEEANAEVEAEETEEAAEAAAVIDSEVAEEETAEALAGDGGAEHEGVTGADERAAGAKATGQTEEARVDPASDPDAPIIKDGSDDSDDEIDEPAGGDAQFETQQAESDGEVEGEVTIDLQGASPTDVVNRDITVFYLEQGQRVPSVGKVVQLCKSSLKVVFERGVDAVAYEVDDNDEWEWGDDTVEHSKMFSSAPMETVKRNRLPPSAHVIVLGKKRSPVWIPIRDNSGHVNEAMLKEAAIVVYHESFDGLPVKVPENTRSVVSELCNLLKKHKHAAERADKGTTKVGEKAKTSGDSISLTDGKFRGWSRKQSKSCGKFYLVSPDGKTKLWESQALKQLKEADAARSPREYPAPRTLEYGSEKKKPKPEEGKKRVREVADQPSKNDLKLAIGAMIARGIDPSVQLGVFLEKLGEEIGIDVRPQKPLVKELLLKTLRKQAGLA